MSNLSTLFSRDWVKNLLWLIAVGIIFVGVRAWQQQAMPKGQAPEISGVATNGKSVSLSDFRGRPLMLYFWATWCRICEFEQSSIRSIAQDHPVLSVALRSGNTMQVERYLQEHGLQFSTLTDEFGEIAAQYGVRGTPTAFFIDAKGRIRSIEVGYTSESGMRLRLWIAGL